MNKGEKKCYQNEACNYLIGNGVICFQVGVSIGVYNGLKYTKGQVYNIRRLRVYTLGTGKERRSAHCTSDEAPICRKTRSGTGHENEGKLHVFGQNF